MKKRTLVTMLGLGLAGLGLYASRRKLIARLLRLPPVQNDVAVERNLRLLMPDGVALMTDHYSPQVAGSFPTVLIRSPYGRGSDLGTASQGFGFVAQRFAERGYHVVIQTTRGCLDSEGDFAPLIHEAADGRATLEWIAQQPWYNGVVGMWGPSYLGYVQWAVATAAPPQLKALVPIIALSQGYPTAYMDGAYALDTALRAVFLFDSMSNKNEQSFWKSYRHWRRLEEIVGPAFFHLPLIEADKVVVGQAVPSYREGFAHPDAADPYWKAGDHHANLAQVTAPTHLISGWYDFLLRGLLADYAALRAAGRRPYLTIGPWYHVDLEWVPLSLREALAWFDTHLKGEPGHLRQRPVRIYVMGADEWRELDEWPPTARETRYYLHAQAGLSPEGPAENEPADHYRYDPVDPTPNLAGPLLLRPAGPVDNRELEARPDVLCYTTPPLAEDVEVIGPVRLELYARSSLEHTDFFGRLCDVHPDGRSINICDGLFRVEPGRGQPQPDGSRRVEIDMWATAQRFLRGHRIRLQVSSGAHPRWNRNLGTGEPIATGTAMVAAEQTIYHDSEHPSALVLPLQEIT